jgi:hypothetical protein
MRITDALLGEHGVFYAQFDRLEETLPSEDGLEAMRAQASMLAAALGPHARLENVLLFAAVEERLGVAAGPMAVMREEHDEIETALARAERATDADRARDDLLEVVRLARAHFEKEERVAFALAERALGEAELERLGEAWARERSVVLG